MNCTLIAFSPTGGTLKVAKSLAKNFGKISSTVDLTSREFDRLENEKKVLSPNSDIAILAIPSFGGRVPKLASQRLTKIEAKGIKTILLCVYGNRAYEDTLVEMQDLAQSCGFQVIAAIAAIAEHSIMRQYATDRPDTDDNRTLAEMAQKIVAKISEHDNSLHSILPGNRPYKEVHPFPLIPKPTSRGNHCGTCAVNCPSGAISPTDLESDPQICISCMRCINHCPLQARQIAPELLKLITEKVGPLCEGHKTPELYL